MRHGGARKGQRYDHNSHAHLWAVVARSEVDRAGGEPELSSGAQNDKHTSSKMLLRSDMQACAQALEATRRLPELGGSSGKAGVSWSLVGAGEESGSDTASRGEESLSKTKWGECLE